MTGTWILIITGLMGLPYVMKQPHDEHKPHPLTVGQVLESLPDLRTTELEPRLSDQCYS